MGEGSDHVAMAGGARLDGKLHARVASLLGRACAFLHPGLRALRSPRQTGQGKRGVDWASRIARLGRALGSRKDAWLGLAGARCTSPRHDTPVVTQSNRGVMARKVAPGLRSVRLSKV